MPTGVYFFNAARCFRSEFRREIFAFAASSCPVFERLVRNGRSCGFFPLPADGIRGWVGCIVSRTIGCVRIGPADGDPALDMPVNAPGHDLFQATSRMSNVAESAVRDCRPTRAYSAACLTCRAVGVRIVTSSSAAVGCSAMVASKSALVAFIFTAMAIA
jgi:hypothetical protein